jgi:hypothetical protein
MRGKKERIMAQSERMEISGPAIRRRSLMEELRQRLPEVVVEDDRIIRLPLDRLAELRALADDYLCEVHLLSRLTLTPQAERGQ